jgi:hypothetical protein
MAAILTILKVLGLSLLLSLLIKYGLPHLAIPTDDRLALAIVLLPTLVIAIGLGVGAIGAPEQHH